MVSKRYNITLDPNIYEDFCKYAGKHGIKVSTWIGVKMKEFIEEQKVLEEMRKEKRL